MGQCVAFLRMLWRRQGGVESASTPDYSSHTDLSVQQTNPRSHGASGRRVAHEALCWTQGERVCHVVGLIASTVGSRTICLSNYKPTLLHHHYIQHTDISYITNNQLPNLLAPQGRCSCAKSPADLQCHRCYQSRQHCRAPPLPTHRARP